MNILIAGCGYVGLRLAARLHERGHRVYGLRRHPSEAPPFLTWIQGDLTSTASLVMPDSIEAVVLAAGLRRDTEERYEHLFVRGYGRLLEQLFSRAKAPDRCLMVSTTGVFAECDGGWVDEASPVDAARSPSRYYLEAERLVRGTGPAARIVRLSGIYGPERFRLIREVREHRAVRIPPPPHYLNQIHADDAAGAIAHVLTLEAPAPLYVASDLEPADRNTVLQWISGQLGLGEVPVDPSPEARPARRAGNKRCDATALVKSGYRFRYPTYREGYSVLLAGA